MAFSFNVDWDQENEQPTSRPPQDSEESAPPAQDALAWEVNFSSGAAKKPTLPKFLRDRDRMLRSTSSEPLKSNPKSRQPNRSSSSPLKAKDPTPSPSKSSSYTSLKAKSTTRRESSGSPKKSPTIKKPLLPVTSPTKSLARSADTKSRSESCLTLRTSNTVAKKKRTRPHSAIATLGMTGRGGSRGDARQEFEETSVEDLVSVGRTTRDNKQSRAEMPACSEMPRVSKSLPVVHVEVEEDKCLTKMATTPDEMAQRKVLDLKRWYCMCHPQYSMSCGISSVVSCWNYLFSTLGNGSLPPLTQEEALTMLGFQPPFGEIRFGPFTGNVTCMRWFQQLCGYFGVNGHAYYFYKPVGRRRTVGMGPSLALEKLQEGLRSANMAFVYHCANHYFCPIGYEQVPKRPIDAYRVGLIPSEVNSWILIGEPSGKQSAIHSVKWDNIVKDLTCKSPQYFNIRHIHRGVVVRRTKHKGRNIHCIMALKRVEESISASLVAYGAAKAGDSDAEEVTQSEVEELESSDSDGPDSQRGDRIDSPPNLNVDLDMSKPYPSATCTAEPKQEPVSSGVRRSGTFTKEAPSVQVKLTRAPSTDSEVSVGSTGVDLEDYPEYPPTATELFLFEEQDKDTPTADSASNLQRSGTFTKTTPALRNRAWSSDDSDASLNADAQQSTQRDLGGYVCNSDTVTKEDLDAWENVHCVEGDGHETFAKTRDSGDEDTSIANSKAEDSPQHAGRRRGTYTQDEPILALEELTLLTDVDLDITLKASDYGSKNTTSSEED